jgi:hypothetical protein
MENGVTIVPERLDDERNDLGSSSATRIRWRPRRSAEVGELMITLDPGDIREWQASYNEPPP